MRADVSSSLQTTNTPPTIHIRVELQRVVVVAPTAELNWVQNGILIIKFSLLSSPLGYCSFFYNNVGQCSAVQRSASHSEENFECSNNVFRLPAPSPSNSSFLGPLQTFPTVPYRTVPKRSVTTSSLIHFDVDSSTAIRRTTTKKLNQQNQQHCAHISSPLF